ncbi:MAG: hypothetical protein COS92_00225 [Desulfobacterales bacterium CG07_land_8_20_14_0_80_52_14]|nr:MAG: hypothetical protein COS92_00225 [Desulfobacterales bacterium CG07_land_8_20_14_0_80_52_14]
MKNRLLGRKKGNGFIYLGEWSMRKSSAWWVTSDLSQIRLIKLIKLIVQFLYVRELNISGKSCQGKNVYFTIKIKMGKIDGFVKSRHPVEKRGPGVS